MLCRLLHQRNVQLAAIEQFQICCKGILAFAVVDPVHIFFCLTAEPGVKVRRHLLHPINGNILRQIAAGTTDKVALWQLLFRLHGKAVFFCVYPGVCPGTALNGDRFIEKLGKRCFHHFLHRDSIGLTLESVIVCPTESHGHFQISHVSVSSASLCVISFTVCCTATGCKKGFPRLCSITAKTMSSSTAPVVAHAPAAKPFGQ